MTHRIVRLCVCVYVCVCVMMIQASFVFGVLGLCLTEAIAVCRMEQFWAWYTFMMLYLISLRAYLYSKMNMHYFLIDFCYFTCVSCMIAIYVASPDSVNTFQTAFALANGPVLGALIVWRNSLVFHSIDKVRAPPKWCSLSPNMCMHCHRTLASSTFAMRRYADIGRLLCVSAYVDIGIWVSHIERRDMA